MSFQASLEALLYDVCGALSAAIFDSEGEVVQLVGHEGLDPHRLKLIGAYESIFLRQMDDLLALSKCGRTACHVAQYRGAVLITAPLVDGYFLVLLCSPDCNLGQGLRRIGQARPGILGDM